MSVDSLNRPPTLLTMASSFNSSSMVPPFQVTPDDVTQLGDRRGQVIIDNLVIVLAGMGQFLRRPGQAPANGLIRLGSSLPQAFLINRRGARSQKDRHRLGTELPDLRCPLHVDIEDHSHAPVAVGLN